MHPSRWLPLVPIVLAAPAHAGSPAEAARIRQEFTLRNERWELQIKATADATARQALWKEKPNPQEYALQMWNCLRPSLAEDWTLEPGAWLLRITPAQALAPAPADIDTVNANPDRKGPRSPLAEAVLKIRETVEKYHLRSPKLAPMCLALVSARDPGALSLLQKIEAQNPDPKVQGVAALGQAMILKGIGDDADVMKKRLTLLRKAIVNAGDQEVDGVSISHLAEDELYIILHLSKGREAPDLDGADSAGKQIRLSDYKGKVVVLLFWNSGSTDDLDHLLELTGSMQKKFANKPFALIGVNNDPLKTLRDLQQIEGSKVTWPNYSDPTDKLAKEYRVGTRPLAYVLGPDRTIQYFGAPGSFVELAVEALLSEGMKPPSPR
ncbi:redoxin domain-containing protein [Luteolibacter ambystomatis]|uniref:Redoxin domain-containing protein n=1 Tax=Luteolibacter ambystomatis TaxID=2824561 RepID=A0A975G6C0_9BACT|nr:redoxin domain-containing protein [Luteolibacter ambystomatis]QUE49773.1 redoxin domain-containing protein [Luteolibacter ambystomatis]